MDTREYISSGLLELYAAGALPENENARVEEVIKKNPDVRDEFETIQKALYLSAIQNLKIPPENVKFKIFDVINKSKTEDKQIPFTIDDLKRKKKYRYLMAASIAFLVLSLGTNFFLLRKLNEAVNQIAVLSDEKKIIVQEFEAVSKKLDKASSDMEIMKDRGYKMADLKGMEKSPGSNVLAFWNPQTKKVYVGVMSLPVPPPYKQYQLWAISNGKPVDAGVMDIDPADKSLHEMKSMEDAQAFAITLEPKGGSLNPTMDEMYAMGNL